MAAIRLHPTTKKPSVYWYEPNGKKRQKTFATRTDATKFKKIIEAELLTNKYISPFAGQTLIQEWLEVIGYSKQSNRENTKLEHQYKQGLYHLVPEGIRLYLSFLTQMWVKCGSD